MATTKLNNGQLPDTIQNKTIDTSNDIDTTTAKLTITGGSNGQVLSTDGSGNLSWTTAGALGAPTAVVTKTVDESVVSSGTLQDDDDLTYTLTANKSYYVEWRLLIARGDTSNVGTFQVAVEGSSRGFFKSRFDSAPVLCNGTTGQGMGSWSTGGADIAVPTGLFASFVITAETTVTFKWSPVNINTTPIKVLKGSRMLIWEVA